MVCPTGWQTGRGVDKVLKGWSARVHSPTSPQHRLPTPPGPGSRLDTPALRRWLLAGRRWGIKGQQGAEGSGLVSLSSSVNEGRYRYS